jgi:Na+-transporting NADH:ubiquinone oxidoreductase subunit NqrB
VCRDAVARCRSSKATWLCIVLLVLLHVWQTAAGVCWVRVMAKNVQQHVRMWLLNALVARHRLLLVASCQGASKGVFSMQSFKVSVT